jgi:hypothetical protein
MAHIAAYVFNKDFRKGKVFKWNPESYCPCPPQNKIPVNRSRLQGFLLAL